MSLRGRTGTLKACLLIVAPLAAILLNGCTSVTVTPEAGAMEKLAQPQRVLVYDFAVRPQEIQLDPVGAEIAQKIDGTAKTVQEQRVSHAVAGALAKHLVSAIQAMGLPAQRASTPPSPTGTDVLIMGQLVSIDQGDEAERMIIGLGAGRSDVEAHAQIYETIARQRIAIESMSGTAESTVMPGAAETMGVGAIAGHLLVSTAITAGSQFANEDLSANVDAEAGHLGDKLAASLKALFVKQGWIGEP